jgi:hypothetical protein
VKKVFVGGSRKISRLNDQLRERLDSIMAKRLAILVGDANGADKAVQSYLAERHYANVQVFCSAGKCRNNVAGWDIRAVQVAHPAKGFEYFTAKDAAMAREAEVGFMLWDGESAGTMVNAARLVAAGKPVVIYISPVREFRTLRTADEVREVVSVCEATARDRIEQYIAEYAPEFAQPAIFV